jgi:arsenical resistance protein ArsH
VDADVYNSDREFHEDGTMKDSDYRDSPKERLRQRVVDVMEELYKFTLLLRDEADYFTDRYSDRKEKAEREDAVILNSQP